MLSPEAKQTLLDNADLFILHFFPHRIAELKDFHIDLIDKALNERRSLTLFPATHGKPVSGDALVLMADGSRVKMRELSVGDTLISGDGAPDRVTAVFPQGLLRTWEITTASGRQVLAAADHPFLTPTGWVEVRNLQVGMALGNLTVPSILPTEDRSDEECRLAGYFVGDGGCREYGSNLSCNITTADPLVASDLGAIAKEMGFQIGKESHPQRVSLIGGARDWLRKVGLAGHGSHTKRVPEFVFHLPHPKVAQFIGAYFACDGNINLSSKKRLDACCEFYSVNRDLLADIQHLLLRFGIQSNLRKKNGRYKGEVHVSWRLSLTSQDNVARFMEQIPVPGEKAQKIRDWAMERSVFTERVLSDQIVSIEEVDKHECFCITVERDKTYTVNDLITHNTTIISELLPIVAICRNPNIRIANILKNEQDARAITRSIQAELVGNQELIEAFGPFVPEGDDSKTWAQGRFDVAKRTRGGKSSTWAAFGAGSRNALGYRTDWTIMDDTVTDRNSATPEQRASFREWFNQGPITMPDTNLGRITVVGTAFHPEDMYHDLMAMKMPADEKPMWTTTIRRAILDDKGTVLWPEMRPYLFLMEQKLTMGTLDFNKRFQNEAIDPSRLVFREEYVYGGWLNGQQYPGCLDEGYRIGEADPDWRVFCGFDPAIGVKRNRKFCAHITLAVGSCPLHDRCLWVVDLRRDQMTLPQQVDLILERHEMYGAMKSTIETNAYQAGLLQQVKQKMDDMGVSYLIEGHYTTRMNKPDPDAGVQSMSAMVEQGKLHIPWGDAASRVTMGVLVDEMVSYPGKTTDTVMALWFAWRSTNITAPRFKSFNRLNDYTVRWPAPAMYGQSRIINPFYSDQSG